MADKNIGSWLLSTGTWFHSDGYSSGSESRLLQRYFEIGAKRLARELEGFFVLILGDAETREVLVLTDLVGSCHCFQRSLGNTIVLSGSSLLLASLDVCHLDSVGCQEFLYTGIIYEDRTCEQEVRKLGPATVYRFADGKQQSEERYWLATDLRRWIAPWPPRCRQAMGDSNWSSETDRCAIFQPSVRFDGRLRFAFARGCFHWRGSALRDGGLWPTGERRRRHFPRPREDIGPATPAL